jgi:uncharacterized protein YneF (UPF0154 family)
MMDDRLIALTLVILTYVATFGAGALIGAHLSLRAVGWYIKRYDETRGKEGE